MHPNVDQTWAPATGVHGHAPRRFLRTVRGTVALCTGPATKYGTLHSRLETGGYVGALDDGELLV
jgi:hypothetical protein